MSISHSGEGLIVGPGLVDLYADPVSAADDRAAELGGFHRVLGVPDGRSGRGERALPLAGPDGGPGDPGIPAAGDRPVFSGGRAAFPSDRTLDRLLQYAAGLDALVMLRAASATLEEGAIVRTGALVSRTGLPSVSPAAEALSVERIALLAHEHGTRVHLTHLWSEAGVDAVRRVQARGIAITASTTVHHLITDASVVERLHGPVRFQPVLGSSSDRAALADALRDGTLSAVATDHRPLPTESYEGPVQVVEAAQVCSGFALVAVASVLGFEHALQVLSTGPAGVLGIPAEGRCAVDPAGSTTVAGAVLGSGANTPHRGVTFAGCVVSLPDDMAGKIG